MNNLPALRSRAYFVAAVAFAAIAVLVMAAVVLRPAGAAPADTVADRVYGQGGSFTSGTCNLGGVSASSLCLTKHVAIDTAGRLYVSDYGNNRVLEYDTPLTSSVANRVFGQGGSFTSGTCNLGGISASSLCQPDGVAVDAVGRLYVADHVNNRVLEYDSPLTSSVADRVFGQGGSFTSNACNLGGISANSLCRPAGLVLDSAGRLYVTDYNNHRVLEYDSPLTSQISNRSFGQAGSFTTNTCNLGGINASSLCSANDVESDSAGRLYIADYDNHRVLEYDSPLTSQTADRVFGQGGSFTSASANLGGVSASSLNGPTGVAVDSVGHLYIADYGNNRVLEYDTPLTSSAADRVFGQGGSFTSNACNLGGISANSLCTPYAVGVDAVGNLYIGDSGDLRVLEYDSPVAPIPTATPSPTPSPTPTPPPTNTPTPVVTNSPTPVVTNSPTPVVTNSPTPVVTNSPTPTPTPHTPTPTPNTPTPTLCGICVSPPPTGAVGGFVDVVTTGGSSSGGGSMLIVLGMLFVVAAAGLAVGGYRKAAGR